VSLHWYIEQLKSRCKHWGYCNGRPSYGNWKPSHEVAPATLAASCQIVIFRLAVTYFPFPIQACFFQLRSTCAINVRFPNLLSLFNQKRTFFILWSWTFTVTFEDDLHSVKANQRAEHSGQRSFRSKVIVHTHRHTHTTTDCSTRPLKRSVNIGKQNALYVPHRSTRLATN